MSVCVCAGGGRENLNVNLEVARAALCMHVAFTGGGGEMRACSVHGNSSGVSRWCFMLTTRLVLTERLCFSVLFFKPYLCMPDLSGNLYRLYNCSIV